MMERETGIEPALVAWKATVLPLNYSRAGSCIVQQTGLERTAFGAPTAGKAIGCCDAAFSATFDNLKGGGGRWIRTTEGVSQQIYSLPPLAAWVSLRSLRATHPVNP